MGSELLNDVQAFLRRYVVLSDAQATAVVLWAAHTHSIDAFEVTPFLAVNSPEKRCGKTRLLDVLELLVAKPWRTVMPSEAVVFRKIDSDGPTLMLDETDAIFNAKNGNTEPLRALLNAGNRRGTSVPRCVGPTQQIHSFSVFSAKALAGIGTLPDTITDRSIVIRMARKRPDETVSRFRFREARAEAEALHARLAEWAEASLEELEAARPAVPSVLDDRAEEAWEPLLAIADLAGGNWPARARLATTSLAGTEDDEAFGGWLLRDVQTVFTASKTDRFSSTELATTLSAIEESPWGDIHGKPLDARGLARRLKPFDVRPRTIRLDDGKTPKGYHLEQFEDAFSRYLDGSNRHNATTPMNTGFAADSQPPHAADEKSRKPAWTNSCVSVAERGGEGTESDVLLPGDAGYPLMISVALTDGHITEREHDQFAAAHRLIRKPLA